MIKDLPVTEFLRDTASPAPAPGGGSVAALAGALGAALSLMAANLSEGEAAAALRERGEALLARLEANMDADAAAFNAVMAALRLPRAAPAEKTARTAAVQAALKAAALLPLETAEACVQALALARDALDAGNPRLASDAAGAGHLAHAGLWGAVYNVRINLGSIRDAAFVEAARGRVDAALREGDALLGRIRGLADERIRG